MENHKSDWDFYFCRVNDQLASISVDLGFNKSAPVKKLPIRLWVSVVLQDPDERGLPKQEEAERLAQFEDAMAEKLAEKLTAVQVGRIKSDGKQELFFYAPVDTNFEEEVDDVIVDFSEYSYTVDAAEDPSWSDYIDLLYPDPYNFQSIQNRRVVQQLENHGDCSDIEREVDHSVQFADRVDCEVFISEAEKLGYKLLSPPEKAEGQAVYTVNISRSDVTDWDSVNDYVWELYELAEANNGQYSGWGCPIVKADS